MHTIAQAQEFIAVAADVDADVTIVQDMDLVYVGGGTGGAVLF